MSVITEFTVPAESFALARTFEEVPELTVEADRVATHSREWILPFVWVSCDDLGRFDAAVGDDPTVEEAVRVDTSDGTGLYSVHWGDDVLQLVDEIIDQHGIMLEAEARGGEWHLKIRFIEQQRVGQFRAYFDERGRSFTLDRLNPSVAPKHREFDLTPEQREALVTAVEVGYFAVPRDAEMADVAERLGVSSSAVSQRLRRATAALVRNALIVEAGPTTDES